MDTLRVLIVDDDQSVGAVLAALIAQAGYSTVRAKSARGALEVLNGQAIDLVITDLRMPDVDGFALLHQVKQVWPDLPVVMLTAHGNVSLAVQAMRVGASDFLLKPFEREEVVATVKRVLAEHAARRASPARAPARETQILGTSTTIQALRQRVTRAAQSQATVLLCGESGSGKELVARHIHQQSARSARTLIIAELSAIPEQLMELALFGQAHGVKPGRIELAEGGTLFLDEVAALSLALQSKLVRLLQERSFEALGSAEPRRADVRLIAGTQQNLPLRVEQGRFRADLYYALNVVPIQLPALRTRQEDLRALTEHFCSAFARQHEQKPPRFSADAWSVLSQHSWPGNVRELASLIERLVVLHAGETLTGAGLSAELLRGSAATESTTSVVLGERRPARFDQDDALDLEARVRKVERATLAIALRKAGGNRSLAARILGISRRTLYNKLAEYEQTDLGAGGDETE